MRAGSCPMRAAVLPLAAHENFPVALTLLGRRTRTHLMAIYGFARLTTRSATRPTATGSRCSTGSSEDLGRVFDGEPEHPLLRALVPTVRACGLPREPFLRLIEANRRDQEEVAYRTFDELLEYCTLSANPVGELVLHVFGAASPARIALSDPSARGSSWSSTGRTSPRTIAAGGSTSRPRTWTGSASVPATSRRRSCESPAPRAARLRGGPGASGCSTTARRSSGFCAGVRASRWRAMSAAAARTPAAIAAAGYDVLAGPPRAAAGRRCVTVLRTFGAGR